MGELLTPVRTCGRYGTTSPTNADTKHRPSKSPTSTEKQVGTLGDGMRVTLRIGSVLFVPARDQLPELHEILEDHLVKPSELTTSDRPKSLQQVP